MYIETIESTDNQPDTYKVFLKSIDEKILSVADVLIYVGYAQLAEKSSVDTEEEMFKVLFLSSCTLRNVNAIATHLTVQCFPTE